MTLKHNFQHCFDFAVKRNYDDTVIKPSIPCLLKFWIICSSNIEKNGTILYL